MLTLSPLLKLVLGLGLNCTIGYGTVFYSFSLMSLQLENTFGWSSEFIYGIYSLGILFSGLAAPFIGAYLDRWGVRYLMSFGSIVVALSFFGLATIENQWEYILWLLLMEIASILVLYESAFVALTHAAGKKARLPITQITLMAGFASTIFWPLISWLLSITDWRMVYIIIGLLHLFICLPVHFILLKNCKRLVIEKPHADATTNQQITKNPLWRIELMLSIAFGGVAFCITGLQIHIFGMMAELQISEQLAVLAGVLIGPSQVVSRFADMLLGQRINPVYLAILSVSSMLLGMFMLLGSIISPYTVLLFAIAFGLGQGMTYIIRGAVPLYIFGPDNFGAITGRMNGVRMVLTAIAPVSLAMAIKWLGAEQSLLLLMLGMLASIFLLYSVKHSTPQVASTS